MSRSSVAAVCQFFLPYLFMSFSMMRDNVFDEERMTRVG